MAGAPGYVHISQRARTAAASQMAAGAEGAGPMRRRPGMRHPGPVEAGGAPQQVRADRRLNPQDPGVSSEARGFVLYVGLGEAKAAANGTTLVEIVQQLRRSVAQIAPEAESYAAVALAQAGAPGGLGHGERPVRAGEARHEVLDRILDRLQEADRHPVQRASQPSRRRKLGVQGFRLRPRLLHHHCPSVRPCQKQPRKRKHEITKKKKRSQGGQPV